MHLFSVVPGSNLKAWRRPGPLGMGGELCGVSWELPEAMGH